MLIKFKNISANILNFLRITDEQGLISLTNITMMLIIYKIFSSPATSMQDLTALAIGVLGYTAKKVVSK